MKGWIIAAVLLFAVWYFLLRRGSARGFGVSPPVGVRTGGQAPPGYFPGPVGVPGGAVPPGAYGGLSGSQSGNDASNIIGSVGAALGGLGSGIGSILGGIGNGGYLGGGGAPGGGIVDNSTQSVGDNTTYVPGDSVSQSEVGSGDPFGPADQGDLGLGIYG